MPIAVSKKVTILAVSAMVCLDCAQSLITSENHILSYSMSIVLQARDVWTHYWEIKVLPAKMHEAGEDLVMHGTVL